MSKGLFFETESFVSKSFPPFIGAKAASSMQRKFTPVIIEQYNKVANPVFWFQTTRLTFNTANWRTANLKTQNSFSFVRVKFIIYRVKKLKITDRLKFKMQTP